MSKSRGNVVDPWEVIDAHGADAFRWYYLTAKHPWDGYRFSAETVGESVRQFMLTLWNTYSFFVLYANAEGIGREDLEPGFLGPRPLDRLEAAGGGPERDRGDGSLRLHRRRPGDRGLRRGALELVRPALAAAILGR